MNEETSDRWTAQGSAAALVEAYSGFSPLWTDIMGYVYMPTALEAELITYTDLERMWDCGNCATWILFRRGFVVEQSLWEMQHTRVSAVFLLQPH
jgi:hypothetical protein